MFAPGGEPAFPPPVRTGSGSRDRRAAGNRRSRAVSLSAPCRDSPRRDHSRLRARNRQLRQSVALFDARDDQRRTTNEPAALPLSGERKPRRLEWGLCRRGHPREACVAHPQIEQFTPCSGGRNDFGDLERTPIKPDHIRRLRNNFRICGLEDAGASFERKHQFADSLLGDFAQICLDLRGTVLPQPASIGT